MKNIYNVLSSALVEEAVDIRNSAKDQETASGKFLYADGSLVMPVSDDYGIESIYVPNILLPGDDESNDQQSISTQFMDVSLFYSDIISTDEIKKIFHCNMDTLLSIIDMASKDEAKGSLYGIIIVNGDMRLNILHPLIAMMILNGVIELPKTFTCMIYPYPERKTIRSEIVDIYISKIEKMIGEISKNREVPTISMVPRNDLGIDINGILSNIDHTIRLSETSNHIDKVMIPVQMASQGLAIPWYGMIHSGRRGGGYHSRNMFPFLTGNIQSPYRASSGSTCTGNHDNSLFGSLYVLNNMNINSMYFAQCLPPEPGNFVEACRIVSAKALEAHNSVQKTIQKAKAAEAAEAAIIREES